MDSAGASFRSYKGVFESFGIPFGTLDFERTYATDWHHTYRAMGLPEGSWDEADRRWVAHYRQEDTKLVPEARRSLERLLALGIRLGVVTGGDRARVCAEMERLGVGALPETVVCRDDVPFLKPHPAALLQGLENLGLRPAEAAYLGDSPEDILMSRAAGVYSVGLFGGFPNREALRSAGPDQVAESLGQAIECLLDEGRGALP